MEFGSRSFELKLLHLWATVLMPFATAAGFGSAATILAAHVSSYVGEPG